jgi:hypothetical protein
MNLGTHMPDGERRKPIDIEVCRSKVKVTTSKNRTKIYVCLCIMYYVLHVFSVLFFEIVILTFDPQTSSS